jgi:hypothetical protein
LAASIFTADPSASSRTELNGPTITRSPSFRPDSTSKYFSPAMPVFTATNSARLSRTTKTPSSSLRSWPDFSSEACTLVRLGRLSLRGSRTILPSLSTTISRTVVAWIGTDTTLLRVAVVISAVQVNPGRTSGISSSTVTLTLKFVACVAAVGAPVAWIGLLPISVTLPVNVLPGIASIVIFAFCPSCTLGMSVSSTSTSASITDMSATVSRTVPALFMVPTTTVSPSSMLRRVMMPVIGDSMRTLLRLYLAFSSDASSCCMRRRCVSICRSDELTSACRIFS